MKPLNKNNRIVGGIEAQPNSWPWAVVIYQITYSNDLSAPKTKFICGGTIISEKYILTAAHCIVRQTEVLGPRNFKIQFGAHDLKKSGFFSEISEIKVHEKYTISQHRNDIALMKLAVPLDFDSLQNVRPVCLPTLEMEKYNLVGTMSYLVGWGTTSQGGRANHVLHEVQIPISDVKDCAKKYSLLLSASDQVSDNQMCASYPEGGKDTCQVLNHF
jgi:secreted trypsin-like serine protease